MGGGGGNFNMGPQNYGFNNYGEIARGAHSGGEVAAEKWEVEAAKERWQEHERHLHHHQLLHH